MVRGPFGGSLKKAIFKPSGYAVFEQQHAIKNQFEDFRYFVDYEKFNEMARFSVSPGDLIMSCSGTMGKVAMVPASAPIGIINQALLKISPLINLDPNYLLLWMGSPGFQKQLGETTMGVAIKNVASVKTLKSLPIPLPPLDEQKRIVAVLDAAFEGLTRARTHVETNLQNARELFERNVQIRMTSVTETWLCLPLAECFRLKSGDNLTSKAMIHGNYEVYGGNGVAGYHNQSNLTGENVIVGRVGALCGRARFVSDDIWLTDNAFKVVDYQRYFSPSFLAVLLNFKNLRSLARQAAQPVISNSSLKDLELAFPSDLDEQRKIVSELDDLKRQIDNIQTQYRAKLQDLDDLRQSLLQKAFAGELT